MQCECNMTIANANVNADEKKTSLGYLSFKKQSI